MLTKIVVDGADPITFNIASATPKDTFLVRKMTGLNPPDVNLFLGEYSRDGGTYQGRRVGVRNVVLTIDLNPNPTLGETISSLRERLYKAFLDPLAEADYLKIDLYDDADNIRYLVGYAEKVETEVFDSETLVQVSIICPDPYIRDNAETVFAGVPGWTTVPFTYSGTAGTGFEATSIFTSSSLFFNIVNNGKIMSVTYDFQSGDAIHVITTRGSRCLEFALAGAIAADANEHPGPSSPWPIRWTRMREANRATSIISSMDLTSPWLELHSQSNSVAVYGQNASYLIASIVDLRFTQAYWGV